MSAGRPPRFVIEENPTHGWGWRLLASGNGKQIAASTCHYATEAGAVDAIANVRLLVHRATVDVRDSRDARALALIGNQAVRGR